MNHYSSEIKALPILNSVLPSQIHVRQKNQSLQICTELLISLLMEALNQTQDMVAMVGTALEATGTKKLVRGVISLKLHPLTNASLKHLKLCSDT